MKKKLLAVVSLLVAFVMSFCLLACGEKDNGKGGADEQPPKLTSSTIETAIENIENAKTLNLDLTASVGSDEGETEEVGGNVVISGNKLMYTNEGEVGGYLMDLDTGYAYAIAEDGKCHHIDQPLPSGMLSYAEDVLSSELGGANVDFSQAEQQFVYDKTYGGYVVSVEMKDYINPLLKFAQDAYKDDMTLNDIADIVLKKVTEEETITVEALLQYISGDGFTLIKDSTLAQLLGENANETFDQIFELAKEAGLELTAEQKTAIKNRKVGELAAGVMAVMPDLKEGEPDLGAIFNALFFEKVTAEQVDAVGAYLDTLVDKAMTFLKGTKFRDVIAEAPAAIQAMVKTEDFAITELSAWLGVKVENNNFTEIKFAGKVSHNYSGKDYEDTEFVGDNNYTVDVTVAIDATDTVTDFAVTYADDVTVLPYTVAVIKGYEKGDSVIYFETAGKEIEVSDIQVIYADAATGKFEAIAEAGVTFDAKTNSFVIPEKTIAKVAEKCKTVGSGTLMVSFTMTVDEVEQIGGVSGVVVVDKSVDVFSGIVSGLLQGSGSGENEKTL